MSSFFRFVSPLGLSTVPRATLRQRVKRLARRYLPLPSALQYRARPLAWLVPRCETRDENSVVPAGDHACSSLSAPPFAQLRMLDPHEPLGIARLRSRSHRLDSDASTKSSCGSSAPEMFYFCSLEALAQVEWRYRYIKNRRPMVGNYSALSPPATCPVHGLTKRVCLQGGHSMLT